MNEALSSALSEVQTWISALVNHLPEILSAIVVFVIFIVLAKALRALTKRIMDRMVDNEAVKHLIATIVSVSVISLGLFLALGILQLDKTVTSLLAGVGIIGLALGFAFQDIAENFIAGVLITLRKPFAIGHLIESNDYFGHVEDLDLRSTHLRTLQGQLVRIPNGMVFDSPMINFTQCRARRVDLDCGVSYGDDLEKARRIALEAVADIDGRDQSKEPELFYGEFGDSSINFQLRFWIGNPEQKSFLAARSEAVMAIKKAFDANDIVIPFPIRTLDFSDEGTRLLDEVLEGVSALKADSGRNPKSGGGDNSPN